MSQFQVHTIDSAPADSAASLRTLEQGLGFVPNLAATMAESPVLVNGFVDLRKTLAGGELTGVEREIVALAVSLENDCDYCMAAHSTFALMQKADEDAVARPARATSPRTPSSPRCTASRAAWWRRGATSARRRPRRCSTPATRAAALFEVVAQVGHTTLANFAHSIAGAPLDDQFAPQAWASEKVSD